MSQQKGGEKELVDLFYQRIKTEILSGDEL